MTQLTPHFTLEEFTFSQTASRKGIDNTPDNSRYDVTNNLLILAHGLENVRTKLDSNAIRISSGYRILELNRALSSRDTSYHVKGLAADFSCPSYGSIGDVMDTLSESGIPFDKLILEFNSWIHIQFAEKDSEPRRQSYVINKQGTALYSN